MTGRTVDAYVKELGPEQRRIVEAIRQLVKAAAPKSSEVFKWGEPVFELNGPFAWTKAHANHVTFGFWRGVDVDGGVGILESSGSKMGHIKLRSLSDVDVRVLSGIVRKAADLNRRLGDPTKTR